MIVSLEWLKDYIKFDLPAEELAAKLSVSGTEVEAINKGLDENIVVAEILEIRKHPNADRLQIAVVTDGNKNYTVVCGAPNIAVGQKVPLAKIGAKLPEFEIKKSVIRGEESEGMLCAEDELGLGEDHSGIIILPKDSSVGTLVSEYLGGETTLDLEITPNRGDCLSHIGIAREIGAILGTAFKKEPISLNMGSANINERYSVSIEENEICNQYMARYISGVKVGPSPKWLQDRLKAVGAKPINNVVDVTNYVMLDLGQPLHSFDADAIGGKEIIIRKNRKSEKITTLDDVERTLDESVVIADKKKAIAIAGIMGGKDTEVKQNTKNILLESAEFNRKAIRKSSKKLSLVTDASYRFERGIDSGSVEYALNKAAKMIQEIAGGQIYSGIAKAGHKPEQFSLGIQYDKINKLCGLSLPDSVINRILNTLGFEIKDETTFVPLWRHDIEYWQDLAEEIARINGYENIIPIPLKPVRATKKSDYYTKEQIKNILIDCGISETINYPYISEGEAKSQKLNVEDLLEIKNPIQPENKYLRNSIIPGLLKSVAKNPAFDGIYLFEIGKIFNKNSEKQSLGIITAGKNAKNIIENALSNINKALKKKFKEIVEVEKDELNKYKIKKSNVFFAEIILDEKVLSRVKITDSALKLSKKIISYSPVSKYPAITRDLAFVVSEKTDPVEIGNVISGTSERITWVELFDEFASDKFGKGKKNVAFHINIEHPDRTMTDREADDIIKKVIKSIEEKFKAKLRS